MYWLLWRLVRVQRDAEAGASSWMGWSRRGLGLMKRAVVKRGRFKEMVEKTPLYWLCGGWCECKQEAGASSAYREAIERGGEGTEEDWGETRSDQEPNFRQNEQQTYQPC